MSRAAQPRAETERGLPRVSLLRILRRRWLAIVLAVIAGTAFVLIVSKQQAPQFEATGRVFLNTSDVAFGGGSDSVDATRVVQTQAQLAGSTAALDLISKQLKVPWRTVAKQVKVTASDEGYFFDRRQGQYRGEVGTSRPGRRGCLSAAPRPVRSERQQHGQQADGAA
ncbi:Wzz/FepE/Etk N-terminal domain-containing protein [Candidatus Protofrankia californiensis]|uniref:Wzz/FepE/Etk N-terminal domain-containing protein n=1 Tax=Candidatus Protofrankia californiensis TaxID=1839754 RepID=UPI001040E93D|nr:Wzz/FepE/Etk N-terminal domain-containing protein [Candidatus Protofrankia californiensis]